MRTRGSLPLLLTIALVLGSAGLTGCAAPAEQKGQPQEAAAPAQPETAAPPAEQTPAEAKAPEGKEAPAKPQTPAAEEALKQADAAYDNDRYIEAQELYKKAEELGAKVPESRTKKVQAKVKQLYEQANESLVEMGKKRDAGQLEDAVKVGTEFAKTEVYRRDEGIRKIADDAKAQVEAALKQRDEQRQQVAKTLEEAEKKVGAGDLAGAAELLAQVEKTDTFAREKPVRKQVGILREKITDAQEQLAEQRGEVDGLLKVAQARMEKGDFDAAAKKVDEAADKDVCKTDGDLRKRVEAMKAAVDDTAKKQAQQREEAAKKEAQEREDVTKLLAQAQEKLAASDFAAALDLVTAAEQKELLKRDAALARQAKDLRAKAADGQSKVARQQADFNDCLKEAKDALAAADFEGAEAALKKAEQQALYQTSEDAKKAVQAVKTDIEAGRKKVVEQADALKKLVDDAAAKIAAFELEAAEQAVSGLEKMEIYGRDRAARKQIDGLRQQLRKAQDGLKGQADEVGKALSDFDAKLKEGLLDQAAAALQKAEKSPLFARDKAVQERVARGKGELEAAQKAVGQARDEVLKLLAQADEKLKALNVAAALELVGAAEQKDVTKRDSALAKQVKDLRARAAEIDKNLAGGRQEVEKLLKAAQASIGKWDFEGADKQVADAAQKEICKVDEGLRKRVEEMKGAVAAAAKSVVQEREQVQKLIKQAEEKLAASQFAAAIEALENASVTELYAREKATKEQVDALKSKALKGEEEAADKRKAEAQKLYDDGMAAYDGKDYFNARQLLDKAAAMNVSLGGRADKKMAKTRETVAASLKECEAQYQQGLRLVQLGEFADAKAVFVALQESGINCGPDTANGVAAQLKGIDDKIRAQKLAQAAEREKALQEMEQSRQKLLAALEGKQQVIESVASAKTDMEAGRLDEAKAAVDAATELLKKLPVKEDAELQKAQAELEPLRGEVEKRIAAKKEHEAKVAKLQEMLAEADKLRTADLTASEQKLIEALDYAKGSGLKLTSEQQDLVDAVRDAVEGAGGAAGRQRAASCWALVQQSDKFLEAGEPETALAMLKIVAAAKGVPLGLARRQQLAAKIADVSDKVAKHDEAFQAAAKRAEEAGALLKQGKDGESLKAYADALVAAQQAGASGAPLEMLLGEYQKAAAAVLPKLIKAQVELVTKDAEARAATALAQGDYRMARFYMAAGSPDLAKELLQKVAGDKAVGVEAQQWAAEALNGIDERIKALTDRELLAASETLAAVYQLEKQFQDAAKVSDMKKVRDLGSKISAERAKLLAQKVTVLLDRGAYPLADKLIQDNKDLIAKHPQVEALKTAASQVETWKKEGEQIAAGLAALKQRDMDGLGSVLSGLSLGLPRDPYVETVDALKAVREALAGASAAGKDLEAKQAEMLSSIAGELETAKARVAARGGYLKAVELYAGGSWDEAAAALAALSESPAGLRKFEVQHVDAMLKKAREQAGVAGETMAEQRREAEKLLGQASAKVDAKDFEGAGAALSSLEKGEVCKADGEFRARVAALRQRLQDEQVGAAAQPTPGVGPEQPLALIERAVADRRFTTAADALDALKKTDSYKSDDNVRQGADVLSARVAAAEKEATTLYAEAAEAFGASDKQKLRKLLDELKSQYQHTRTFEEHNR